MQLSLFPHSSEKSHWTVFIDGASRNNPGLAGAGIYLVKDGQEHAKYGFYVGIKTNNEAEYYALLLGLFLIQKYKNTADETVRIVSDSLLVVNQMRGQWRVKKPELIALHGCAQSLFTTLNATIMHVLRADNSEADAMANYGIDTKTPLPESFRAFLQSYGIPT